MPQNLGPDGTVVVLLVHGEDHVRNVGREVVAVVQVAGVIG